MDEQRNGQMDGRTDGWTDRWREGGMDGPTDGHMDGQMKMDNRTNGQRGKAGCSKQLKDLARDLTTSVQQL